MVLTEALASLKTADLRYETTSLTKKKKSSIFQSFKLNCTSWLFLLGKAKAKQHFQLYSL